MDPDPTVTPESDLRRATAPRTMSAREWYARDVVSVLGLPFDVVDVEGAVQTIREAARERRRCFVSTPNVNFAVTAFDDTMFRDIVLRSDLNLADGAPIVRLGRWLGALLPERVAGATVFEALRRHPGRPLNVYFFGGPVGAAARAACALDAENGGLRCVGFDDGGFGSVESLGDPGTIDRINASGADLLVAALGARKGQAWLALHARRLEVPVLCHLGAVINFASDTIRRAPAAWQAAGLEWLWRIREEPSIWRRYADDGAVLARLLLTEVLANVSRDPATSVQPSLAVTRHVDEEDWRLCGHWRRDDLGPLQDALVTADADRFKIIVRLNDVRSVDPSFIGLLQIAEGRLGRERFAWTGAVGSVAKRFRRALVPVDSRRPPHPA